MARVSLITFFQTWLILWKRIFWIMSFFPKIKIYFLPLHNALQFLSFSQNSLKSELPFFFTEHKQYDFMQNWEQFRYALLISQFVCLLHGISFCMHFSPVKKNNSCVNVRTIINSRIGNAHLELFFFFWNNQEHASY